MWSRGDILEKTLVWQKCFMCWNCAASLGLPTIQKWIYDPATQTLEIHVFYCFSYQRHLWFIYPIYLSCLIGRAPHLFFGPGNGSRITLKVLEPVSPTLPARHVFHACHLRFGVKNCIRLWHSTSFWTWSPRWFVTTPCASWVSGSRKNPDDFRLLPGKSAAVLWLLKTEDVLMKIDEYVQIVINCYIYTVFTVTIVWVQHGSTSLESQSPCSFQS